MLSLCCRGQLTLINEIFLLFFDKNTLTNEISQNIIQENNYKGGIVMARFLKWFTIFGALGCIAMFFFYTLIIITHYNFHLLLFVMIVCIAMILAIIFALIEKIDSNVHKLAQKTQELLKAQGNSEHRDFEDKPENCENHKSLADLF
jgi:amino acid permease